MKLALATTTIHVPHVLKQMRKCSSDVRFFVASDDRNHREVIDFCVSVKNTQSMLALPQWKSSEALGWNTLARRNIAFLEALKWGADIVYSWDNDNLPMNTEHFWRLSLPFDRPFNGILALSPAGWFDPGALLYPWTKHRGIPHGIKLSHQYDIITDAKVGIAAGLVLGDPDIDATTRLEAHPDIQVVSEAARSGVLVDVNTHTVFNTQNTAVLRELVPAWFLMPGVGRHDDIYASLVVQRVARERGYHVHFGQPFTYQQRNEHDLIKDLRAELDGMEKVVQLAHLLDSIPLPGKSVIEDTAIIYETLAHCGMFPKQMIQAARWWLDDCEEALG